MISHHLVKFGCHWHRGSGDITFVVFKNTHPHACLNPPLLLIKSTQHVLLISPILVIYI